VLKRDVKLQLTNTLQYAAIFEVNLAVFSLDANGDYNKTFVWQGAIVTSAQET